MSNPPLVASERPRDAACNVYPLPALSVFKADDTATPFTADTDWVPPSVPPAGLLAIPTVTVPVRGVAVLPKASRAATRTAGLIFAPAVVVLGCRVKLSCVAAPGVMLNALLVRVRVPASATSR